LITFILCNAITLLVDAILNGLLGDIFAGFQAITQPDEPIFSLVTLIYTLTLLAGLVAQLVAVIVGWKAYRVAQNSGITQSGGGDWASGGGRVQMARDDRSDVQRPASRPANNFQLFGGGGQRLGDS
jgi:hypothetical protein